jgi:hypothetical protein
MEDNTSNLLSDSKNEWSILLMNYITPHIMDGFRSIFNESVTLCEHNEEPEKYLMTFQNLLTRIPKWNQQLIDTERERIVKLCNCNYLEDLMVCVHIIQLKILSCVRVGNESKKINIDIPDFGIFIHNIYTNIARKLYSTIYLFELEVSGLEKQKRTREFELLVQTCIMNTIRDRIPIESLLRQYMDESSEIEVKVEKPKEEKPMEDKPKEDKPKDVCEAVKFDDKPMPQPLVQPVAQPVAQPLAQPVAQPEPKFESLPETKPSISFNPSIESFDLPEDDGFSIGEDVPINVMNFCDLEPTIDLGIVEL